MTLSLILISAGVGAGLSWFSCRKQIADLEFEKEMVLDFNEKLTRDRDEIEHHDCQWKEEEWPEVVG